MNGKLQRVIFTCGGTAGHVNPAVAHRPFAPRVTRHNPLALYTLPRAPGEARAILRQFRPDAVIGTGGYASYPMVKAAARAGIATAVHESNVVPGLTTEMLEPFAGRILVGFEACCQHYRHPEKVVVTGTPVRQDFFDLSKAEAKAKLGVDDGRPLIVSFWGSLGASAMNARTAELLALEAKNEPFHHIHGAGKAGYPGFLRSLSEKGVDLDAHPALQVREYIYDMALVMRAADLVVSRAGASTLSELTALGVPAGLVAAPNVSKAHPPKNARALEEAGAAVLLPEKDASPQALFQVCGGILHDPARQAEMAGNMAALGVPDAAERILDTVRALL